MAKKIPAKHKMFVHHSVTDDLDGMLEKLSYAGEKTVKKALKAKKDSEMQYRCDQETPPHMDIYEVSITFKKVKL